MHTTPPADDRPSTRGRRRRRLAALLAVVVAAGSLLVVDATPASAANSGSAMCANQAPVVGVWVTVDGGKSGWATRRGSGYQQSWSYNTQGKSYKLTVGCGGTPQKWRASTSTPTFSKTWSHVVCFPGKSYGYGSVYVSDRCYRG